MPTTKTAKKELRKTKRQTEVNRRNRTRLRSAIKKLRALIAAGESEKARALWPEVMSVIDTSAKKGVIHRRTAARQKSRLSAALARPTKAA
jgi:small subunit ribosomal protein S20